MELEQLTNRQKGKLFNLVIILLFIFVSYKYIYKNQAKTLDSLKAKKDLEPKINEVLKNIIAQEGSIGSYKSFLLKDSSLIISRISDIVKNEGVELVSIRPSPEQRNADYIRFPFDLVINVPGFHTLGKFISELENSKDIYIVDYIVITGNDENKKLNVSLKISAIGNID